MHLIDSNSFSENQNLEFIDKIMKLLLAVILDDLVIFLDMIKQMKNIDAIHKKKSMNMIIKKIVF